MGNKKTATGELQFDKCKKFHLHIVSGITGK
jgi:hypothetical protein